MFVSAGGDDGAAGKKASPVKTVTKGVELAALRGLPRVYVCEGTYDTNVLLTTAVSLYGGLACTWTVADVKPKLAPLKGIALRITKVTDPVVVEDFEITGAADTKTPGDSATAMFVASSPKVTLRRVVLHAGPGIKAKDETQAAAGALMTSMPTAVNGGLAQLCTCVGGGTSQGGAGGSINGDGSPGETAQATPSPTTATGAGGTKNDCAGLSAGGRAGSDAPSALSGAGATSAGTLTENGWTPEGGKDASPGTPGQGGGGGGGSAGGGGSGACGGCGGVGGKGGGGGGASVALVTLDSPVALIGANLTAADGGAGGAGGAGGDGIAGGIKGVQGGGACPGGKGGSGGGGGAGAGGVSAGVLSKGAKPTLDATKITTGSGGPKGVGAGSDGIEGPKADVVVAP